MKVYVVQFYEIVIGVYSTLELAKTAQSEASELEYGHTGEIVECELDAKWAYIQ